jgi:hypothetical protein
VSAYNLALFVHVLGVVALFVAIGVQQWGGAQVRRADTLEHLRLWLGLVGASQNLYPAAIVLLLAGGLFMAGTAWSFTTPWIVVALIGLAGMIVLGILVVGRRFAAIESAAPAGSSGPVPTDVARLVARPGVWACLFALNGTAIGILWLMTNKPGWAGSIAGVAVVTAVLGALGATAAKPKGNRAVERLVP